jgi:alkanesulfonate monooxygenase SsuD/methylene tetrahydromethanopterin reductase-like flavin-dependent oxidoreductase (luciferase family)
MPRTLRVGIQLPEVERLVRFGELVAMARAAEEVGFDSIWLGDHLLYRGDGRPERGPWDCWTALAGLAAATERVKLGPLVACLAFHPPALLARMAATVDEISRGRLILGVGAGWNRAEFDAFGIPFDHRGARFEEAFEIVRRLLGGERVTVDGRFHRTHDAVLLPPPTDRIPLMVGSSGDRVLAATLPFVERAGRGPATIERSACVLVVLDRSSGDRPVADGIEPLEGSARAIADGLEAFAEAGADEVILVASPITEGSIRTLREAIALLRS